MKKSGHNNLEVKHFFSSSKLFHDFLGLALRNKTPEEGQKDQNQTATAKF